MNGADQGVRVGSLGLAALVGLCPTPKGLVIFAHGSGSGRLSPRNGYVAERLRARGLATLLLDLLTPAEELDRRNVFDIGLLAERLRIAVDWAAGHAATAGLRPCFFGASTGGGAALRAAANDPRIAAIVSRGGRPDLAGAGPLSRVTAPTLLLVGSRDEPVIELNRIALQAMRCRRELVVISGAGHLFEEPGALNEVVSQAGAWFLRHLEDAS